MPQGARGGRGRVSRSGKCSHLGVTGGVVEAAWAAQKTLKDLLPREVPARELLLPFSQKSDFGSNRGVDQLRRAVMSINTRWRQHASCSSSSNISNMTQQ